MPDHFTDAYDFDHSTHCHDIQVSHNALTLCYTYDTSINMTYLYPDIYRVYVEAYSEFTITDDGGVRSITPGKYDFN